MSGLSIVRYGDVLAVHPDGAEVVVGMMYLDVGMGKVFVEIGSHAFLEGVGPEWVLDLDVELGGQVLVSF